MVADGYGWHSPSRVVALHKIKRLDIYIFGGDNSWLDNGTASTNALGTILDFNLVVCGEEHLVSITCRQNPATHPRQRVAKHSNPTTVLPQHKVAIC